MVGSVGRTCAGTVALALVSALAACAPSAAPSGDGGGADDTPAGNPIIRDLFTADPAALVHEGRLYLFTGRDEAPDTLRDFVMREWHAFSTDAPSDDPDDWEHHGPLLSLEDFAWADRNAWARGTPPARGGTGASFWTR